MIVVPNDGKILVYGPALDNVESFPVDKTEYLHLPDLRDYMVVLMRRFNGTGLAAPQIGIYRQFILIQRQDGSILDLVNPEITRMYGREVCGFEGCLSVPPNGNGCMVPRNEIVELEYATASEPAVSKSIRLSGMDAVVAQHELDHLTGTFFFDRVTGSARTKVLEAFERWKEKREYAMMKAMPDHSPIVAANLICAQCGDSIAPKIIKNGRGVVEHLEYEHRNKVVGCSYTFNTKEYVNTGEMKPLKPVPAEAVA